MRTALAISVALHGLLWGPVAWIAHDPLPPVTHEIAVELVPADKLDELTKAQEPAKPEAAEWRAVPLPAARLEMDRLLLGKHAEEGLDALLVIGALDVWMPEVAAMVGPMCSP